MKYAAIIEPTESCYSAYIPDLPGCIATGETLEAVHRNIQEAAAFHLDGMREDGLPIPPAASVVEYVEIHAV